MPIRIKVTLAILLALLFLLVLGPLLIPVSRLQNTVDARQLADADSRFADLGGVSVHYKLNGDGERNFVLLHGSSTGLVTWQQVVGAFEAWGRVLAFDRPAFGLTSRPPAGMRLTSGVNPYGSEGNVLILSHLMDLHDMGSAILVGNAAGSSLALRVALEHPEQVQALVLVSPVVPGGGNRPGWVQALMRTPQLERLGPLIMRQMAGEPGMQLVRNAWAQPERISDETILAYRQAFRVNDWDRGLWELSKASNEPQLMPFLNTLTVPTLIVVGDADQMVPPEQSERLATEIPGAERVVLAGCGHLPQEECPEALLQAVESFLADLP
jgi:pimeloyl-ACP methyl ester carboxylesterase